MSNSKELEIRALKVNQWLEDWDNVPFTKNRNKPQPYFFVFSIDASTLKRLSKVYPRKADEGRETDLGIQRKHDEDRSKQIRKYVFGGFPWSDLSEKKQSSDEFRDLRMPGWLPTAIIANILAPNSKRGGQTLKKADTIEVEEKSNQAIVRLPGSVFGKNWDPDVPPIEIIDGQHRLWAFDKDEPLNGSFELPVVAFYDLDISWQAYLFYTINIKPKKINASLAFDLYPILRVQDWLERSPEGAFIYKETRAQELTEVMWSHPKSPWHNRINMLGESKTTAPVTQAAFIRSLIASFIKTTSTKSIGGLFGSFLKSGEPLNWNRTQQSAFLIFVWELLERSFSECTLDWAKRLRRYYSTEQGKLFVDEIVNLDAAFASRYSLIATDQGVRGFLHIINDMVYSNSEDLNLQSIAAQGKLREDRIDHDDVTSCLTAFSKQRSLAAYLKAICDELVKFDWRTSSEESLTSSQRQKQMIFKGSSGYKELRRQLLEVLMKSTNTQVATKAKIVTTELGYVG